MTSHVASRLPRENKCLSDPRPLTGIVTAYKTTTQNVSVLGSGFDRCRIDLSLPLLAMVGTLPAAFVPLQLFAYRERIEVGVHYSPQGTHWRTGDYHQAWQN